MTQRRTSFGAGRALRVCNAALRPSRLSGPPRPSPQSTVVSAGGSQSKSRHERPCLACWQMSLASGPDAKVNMNATSAQPSARAAHAAHIACNLRTRARGARGVLRSAIACCLSSELRCAYRLHHVPLSRSAAGVARTRSSRIHARSLEVVQRVLSTLYFVSTAGCVTVCSVRLSGNCTKSSVLAGDTLSL